MREHPINDLLNISLDSLVKMIDVSKIVGQPIILDEKRVIIPISRVAFGFGAGGSEFKGTLKKKNNTELSSDLFPFGGGSGGGISIAPSSFLIIEENSVTLMKADIQTSFQDKIVDHLVNAFLKNKK